MSKKMTDAERLRHCKSATTDLDTTLSNFSGSAIDKFKKRAMLIAYWIKTYVSYLRNEDSFSPNSVFKLKRGSVVRVEFGYRVGRELGGRHYAVVVDEENSMYRNTVTVIPLGSIKESKAETRYTVYLNDGIFTPVYSKLDALISEAESIILNAMQEDIDSATLVNAKTMISKADEWIDEISHMKQGSVASVDQITTISKMRISQPLQKTHPLYGVRLSPEDMDKIDDRLKSLFLPKKVVHNC